MAKAHQDEIEKELKALTRQLTDTAQILSDLQKQKSDIERKKKQLESQLSQLRKPDKLQISEHAILRYAERHYDLPVEKIRKEIFELMDGAQDLQLLKFRGFVVKGNTVVTYTPTTEDSARKAEQVVRQPTG